MCDTQDLGCGRGLQCVDNTGFTVFQSGVLWDDRCWGHGNDPYEHSNVSFLGCGKRILDNLEYTRIRSDKGKGMPDNLRKTRM